MALIGCRQDQFIELSHGLIFVAHPSLFQDNIPFLVKLAHDRIDKSVRFHSAPKLECRSGKINEILGELFICCSVLSLSTLAIVSAGKIIGYPQFLQFFVNPSPLCFLLGR